MSFLNPSFLWFLPLGALPVLIHLLFSVKPVKIEFSSVSLLWSVRRARRRPAKLLQALVLLLRCLAVLALVSAFSKPVLESGPLSRLPGFAAGSGRPLSLVVLADRSYSMSASFGGRSRYDLTAGNSGRILGSLGERDEAALVFFDETAEQAADWTGDAAAVSKAVGAARPGYRATDYAKALEKAYALLASRPPGRKKAALLLTDSARNGFAGFPKDISAVPAYDAQAVLMGFSFGQTPNAWVRGVDGRAGGAGAVELSASLGGESGGGEAGLFSSTPGGAAGKTMRGRFRDGAASFELKTQDPAGRVELAGRDALNADNAAYFSFQWASPREPRVLALYGGEQALRPGGGAYFIKKFFETESGRARSPGLRADFAQYSDERVSTGDYGAVILAGPPSGARWTKALKDYLAAGGGVFLAAVPGGGESPAADQVAFLEAFGLGGGALDRRFTLAQGGAAGFFAGKDLSGFDLSKTAASRVLAPRDAAGFEIPWEFKDEAGARYPALLYKRQGKGRLLVWTSSLDIGYSDLPAKPVFAPFMALSMRLLFGLEEPESRSAAVGGVYEGRLKSAENVRVAVAAPDGSRSYLFPEGGVFKYRLTSQPGLYRWSAPPEAGVFAVNLDHTRGESELAAAKHPPWRVLRPDEPVADFKRALYGVEISQFLLLAALACFLAEFLLSRKIL